MSTADIIAAINAMDNLTEVGLVSAAVSTQFGKLQARANEPKREELVRTLLIKYGIGARVRFTKWAPYKMLEKKTGVIEKWDLPKQVGTVYATVYIKADKGVRLPLRYTRYGDGLIRVGVSSGAWPFEPA